MDTKIGKDPGQVGRPQNDPAIATGEGILATTNRTRDGNRKQWMAFENKVGEGQKGTKSGQDSPVWQRYLQSGMMKQKARDGRPENKTQGGGHNIYDLKISATAEDG